MVLLIIIPIKWLFHWEYTEYTLFPDKPRYLTGTGFNPSVIGDEVVIGCGIFESAPKNLEAATIFLT